MQANEIRDLLCCPVDRCYPLSIEDAEWENGELLSGALRCPGCGNSYPVVGAIPQLIPPREVQPEQVAAAKERESSARDADATVYDSTVPTYQTAVELNTIMGALRPRSGDVILDLGAGTGRLTTAMADKGAMVFALDISPLSLKMNREKCARLKGATVYHIACDVCYLPLRDGIANKGGSAMMLEHIPTDDERRRCLEEINRVLRPCGKLALTAYNFSWSKRKMAQREGFHGSDLYYYRFDRTELRKLLGQYRVRNVTALLNLPGRLQSHLLDRIVAMVPPVAGLTGELLFAVVEKPVPGREPVGLAEAPLRQGASS